MKKILIILFLLITQISFADEYYLGQWKWVDGDLPRWEAPHAEIQTGTIDLRTISQQAQFGGIAEGYAIFSYSQNVSDINLEYLGNDLDQILTEKKKTLVEDKLKLGTFESNNLKGIIWESLTTKADPTGETAPKPIMPNEEMKMQLFLGTGGVKQEITLIPFKSKEWPVVLATLHEDYKKYIRTENQTKIAQILDALEEKYKVPYDYFIPDGEIKIASLPHETTYTEDFNCTGSDSLNCDLTWTESGTSPADIDISGNLALSNAANRVSFARAEHDVSSSDNYVQLDVVYMRESSNTYAWWGLTRYSSSANTGYTFARARRNTPANRYWLSKYVAGTETTLAGESDLAFSFPETWKVEANGSSIKTYLTGVQKHSVTDTAISSGTRGGIVAYSNDGFHVDADNFEVGDLTATTSKTTINSLIINSANIN